MTSCVAELDTIGRAVVEEIFPASGSNTAICSVFKFAPTTVSVVPAFVLAGRTIVARGAERIVSVVEVEPKVLFKVSICVVVRVSAGTCNCNCVGVAETMLHPVPPKLTLVT